jgi:hypothetical protein
MEEKTSEKALETKREEEKEKKTETRRKGFFLSRYQSTLLIRYSAEQGGLELNSYHVVLQGFK